MLANQDTDSYPQLLKDGHSDNLESTQATQENTCLCHRSPSWVSWVKHYRLTGRVCV